MEKLIEGRWSRKRGGAKGGAPRYKGRTAREARAISLWFMTLFPSPGGPCSRCFLSSRYTRLSLVVRCSIFLWFSSPRVVQLFLWSASGSGGGPVRRRRGRKAQLCRRCGANLRGLDEERRREFAGHAGGPEPGASTLAVVGAGRHDSMTTEKGGGR